MLNPDDITNENNKKQKKKKKIGHLFQTILAEC